MRVRKLLLLSFVLCGGLSVNAQSLVVTLTNTNTERFALSDILSVKFGAQSLILNQLNGTVSTWEINDLDYYSFDQELSVDGITVLSTSVIDVYPNPALDKVQIKYISNQMESIRVRVYDNNGRIVEELFDGNHNEETLLTWNVKQNSFVQAGRYVIELTNGSKVMTKSVIIQ